MASEQGAAPFSISMITGTLTAVRVVPQVAPGGELLRLLAAHPDIEIGPVAAGPSAGRPVTEAHPHLTQLAGRSFVPAAAGPLSAADLVFLALPAGQSAALAAQLPGPVKIVDLGPDFP